MKTKIACFMCVAIAFSMATVNATDCVSLFTVKPEASVEQSVAKQSRVDFTPVPMYTPREPVPMTHAKWWQNPIGVPPEGVETFQNHDFSAFSRELKSKYDLDLLEMKRVENSKLTKPNLALSRTPPTEPVNSTRRLSLQEEWMACGEDEICQGAVARKDAVEEGCLSDYFFSPRSFVTIIRNATQKGSKEGVKQLSRKTIKHIEKEHFLPNNVEKYRKLEVDIQSGVSRGTTRTGTEKTYFPPAYRGKTEEIVKEIIENNPLKTRSPNSSTGYHLGKFDEMDVKVIRDTATGAVRTAYPVFPPVPSLNP